MRPCSEPMVNAHYTNSYRVLRFDVKYVQGDQEFLNAKRGKKMRKSTKKYSYDVQDTLCNSVHIKGKENSNSKIDSFPCIKKKTLNK